jgi:predicted aminopeptidase
VPGFQHSLPFAGAAAAAALLAGVLGGCGTPIGYYWQSVSGQVDLVARARPLDEVAAGTDDAALREQLGRVRAIRAFASRELALPDNGSYTRYVDLGRAYVVWNLFAAPELSLVPRQWCFPVAGCVAYRGYFAERDARDEAARLAAEGFDVHVSGVPAYSTLGWFDDPVLSTFVRWREVELARLLFHELAHQVVYVKDDTSFNESFAVAVEEAGLARWLAAQALRPDAATLAADARRASALRAEFRALVAGTRDAVAAIYRGTASAAQQRRDKAAAFAALASGYEAMKARWGGHAAYDRWFGNGPNNASLVAATLYADRVGQFTALLAAEGGDLPRFYRRVRELAALPRGERDARLEAVAGTPAGGGPSGNG